MRKLILTFGLIITIFSQLMIGQDADTLLIEPIHNGNLLGAINRQIKADTNTNGERLHKVYKLKAGEYYYLSNTLVAEFDLNIVGEKADPTDPTKFPPVLTTGTKDDGSLSTKVAITTKGSNTIIKGIYFMGFTQKGTNMNNFVNVLKDESDVLIHNCYFEGSSMFTVKILGNMVNLDFQNNHMRNVFANGGWYNGRGVWFENVVPNKALIKNNTFMNLNSYAFVIKGDGAAKEVIFDHNTIYNVAVNPIRVWRATNLTITNNIIYNGQFLGSTQDEKENNWNDLDMQDAAIFSIAKLPSDWSTTYTDYPELKDISESDRVVTIKNNAVVWHNDIKTLWESQGDEFFPTRIMNDRTQTMFDDDTNYPNLIVENTWEEDPGFTKGPDMEGSSALFTKVRTDNAGMRWGWGHFNMADTEFLYVVNWPLPENLRYSNANYQTASTDGTPLGDAKWFNSTVGIKDNQTHVTANSLELNCYPNPFNNTVNIDIDIKQAGVYSIEIYNTIGQKVKTISHNKNLQSGNHTFTWNATGKMNHVLSNGLYIVSIRGNQTFKAKTITLIK